MAASAKCPNKFTLMILALTSVQITLYVIGTYESANWFNRWSHIIVQRSSTNQL